MFAVDVTCAHVSTMTLDEIFWWKAQLFLKEMYSDRVVASLVFSERPLLASVSRGRGSSPYCTRRG